MSWSEYTSNIYSAVLGNKKEYFQTAPTTVPSKSTASTNWVISVPLLLGIIFTIVFCFMYGYGAASLSYCYNKSMGRSDMEAVMWAITAYIFGGLYYPYYGVFLNPLCGGRPSTIVGGRRR